MTAGILARFSINYPGFSLSVDLRLPGSGVTALFGPSGSGKTTCLRAIAGLERPRGGYLSVNGEIWQDDAKSIFVPTHRRPLGYVFQEPSLFPHLSVRGNLEYGLKRAGREEGDGLERTADILGIAALLDRGPEKLSGGERQRVAIARALLTRPRLLLLDEPLASIDLRRRHEILPYLERLHEELEIPSIYVSHMPDEVARLADHLVLLERGNVIASGPLQETLARLDLPAAFTDDAGVFIEARIAGHSEADELTRLDFAGGTIYVPRRRPPTSAGKVRCRIEARDVSLTLQKQAGTSILNIIPATVVDMAPTEHAAQVLVRLDAGGTPLLARITQRSWNALGLAPGSRVWAQVKTVVLIG